MTTTETPSTKMAAMLGGMRPDDLSRFVRNLNRYSESHGRSIAMSQYIRRSVIPQTLDHLRGIERTVGFSESGLKNLDRYYSQTEWYNIPSAQIASICTFKSIQPVPDQNLPRIAQRLSSCGNYLLFRKYCTIPPDIKLAGANFCEKHLICPFCAIRRSARAAQNLSEKLASILPDNYHLIPAMLTLTVKNGFDLSERIDHLFKSWKRYNQRRKNDNNRGVDNNEISAIEGAAYSFEFTYSSENGWHPHIHALVLLRRYIDKNKLSNEWFDITGDSTIVDIRRVYPGSIADSDVFDAITTDAVKNNSSTIAACCEVMKYAVKFNDLDIPANWHAFNILRGRRLRGSFGILRGVKIDDNLKMTDDLYSEEIPYIDYIMSYQNSTGYYCITNNRRSHSVIFSLLQFSLSEFRRSFVFAPLF